MSERKQQQYRPAISDVALVVLVEIWEHFVGNAGSYEEALAHIGGFRELIEHHPALKVEVAAMTGITQGESMLNELRGVIRAL